MGTPIQSSDQQQKRQRQEAVVNSLMGATFGCSGRMTTSCDGDGILVQQSGPGRPGCGDAAVGRSATGFRRTTEIELQQQQIAAHGSRAAAW
ncbi:hypothetical protein ACFX2B_045576 [Malus domestica]